MRCHVRYTKPIAGMILMLCVQPAGSVNAMAAGEPLTVDWRIESKTLTLGEPILLNYKITNNSAETIFVDWRGENLARSNARVHKLPPWMKLGLTDRYGQPVPPVPDRVMPYTPVDVAMVGPRKELAPGVSREGTVVLSRWYALPQPDDYRLALHVELSFFEGSKPQKLVSSSDQTISFTVIRPNPLLLRRISTKLRKQAVRPADFEQEGTTIESLFAMPEEYALPAWRELARDPSLGLAGAMEVTNQLARIGSASTVSVLYEMAANPENSDETRALSRQGLFKVQANSSPQFKAQIERLLNALDSKQDH